MTTGPDLPARFGEPAGPTAEQRARAKALRRFNRRYVYLPMALLALLWLGLIVGMLWLTLVGDWFNVNTNQAYYRGLISGVADAFTILMLAPFMVLCALPIVAAVALFIWRRQRRRAQPAGPEKLSIFWRLENIVDGVRARVATTTPKLARPVISAHAAGAFARSLLGQTKEIVSREINRYVDR